MFKYLLSFFTAHKGNIRFTELESFKTKNPTISLPIGTLWLMLEKEFDSFKNEQNIYSINGEHYNNRETFDDDTRGGYLSYGLLVPYSNDYTDNFIKTLKSYKEKNIQKVAIRGTQKPIWLLTLSELEKLNDGVVVYSLNGDCYRVGFDAIESADISSTGVLSVGLVEDDF